MSSAMRAGPSLTIARIRVFAAQAGARRACRARSSNESSLLVTEAMPPLA
jgi:hypothetical protein